MHVLIFSPFTSTFIHLLLPSFSPINRFSQLSSFLPLFSSSLSSFTFLSFVPSLCLMMFIHESFFLSSHLILSKNVPEINSVLFPSPSIHMVMDITATFDHQLDQREHQDHFHNNHRRSNQRTTILKPVSSTFPSFFPLSNFFLPFFFIFLLLSFFFLFLHFSSFFPS